MRRKAWRRSCCTAVPDARNVVVVCGPGNNGGDGLAAARLLSGRGLSVSVFTLGDPDSYRGDAAENASRAREAGLGLTPLSRRGEMAALPRRLGAADAVVDALFGTGLTRALSGSAARAVSAINSAGRPVVAADLPSGLSADTGRVARPLREGVGHGGLRGAQARPRLLAGARFLRPGRRPRHRNPAAGASRRRGSLSRSPRRRMSAAGFRPARPIRTRPTSGAWPSSPAPAENRERPSWRPAARCAPEPGSSRSSAPLPSSSQSSPLSPKR